MKLINKKVFQKFLMIIIPIIILWIGLITSNLAKEKDYVIQKIISENSIMDENTSILVDNYFAEILQNLKVVRDANEFKTYINDKTVQNYNEIVGLFVRIMNNKTEYDQIRFIDVEGNEVIRVDNESTTVVIPMEDLKNKKDRYYFQNTINLSNGDIYISPLDLNVEDGKIEEPHKPMLRLSTPIFDEKDNLQGIFIINYRADIFMNLITKHNNHNELVTERFYILDQQGQFILHPDESKSFSFMFENSKELTINDEINGIWNEVSNNKSGSIIDQNMLYTYYDVLQVVTTQNTNYTDKWIILHDINFKQLFSIKRIFQEILLDKNLLILYLIVVLSFVIAFILERMKGKDAQLDITLKIAETTSDAVLITDAKTRITYVNKAFEEATGYTLDEVIGKSPSEFKSGKHGPDFYEKMWKSIQENGQWEGMLWDRKKNDLLYPKRLRILAVKDKNSHVAHDYIGIFSDLSSNRRKSDTYEAIRYVDGQIMLPNEEMMLELLSQSILNEKYSFMVLSIAVENFNQLISSFQNEDFNSTKVFIEIVKPLLSKEDFIAQTGRNLFVVIIDMHHIQTTPEVYINHLHKEITKVISIEGRDIFFKTRIGVSYWPHDTNDLKRLLLNSVIALEWTGKSQDTEIAYFNEKMIEQLNQENKIESYLRSAIEKEEFTMVYQPQVDIKTEKVVGMEALIRWKNPVLGDVSPAIFIPIAEKSNFMVLIGYWVIDRVCKDLEAISVNCNLDENNLKCAINISAIQMKESSFTEQFLEIVNQYDVKHAQLEIEITEGLLLTNEGKSIKILEKFQSEGIKIAIDDFGTGYSSMSYLHKLPIDKIKIDRTFIKHFPEDDDGKLAKILVDMSKTLEKKVLAEGVETLEQIEFLREIGCDYIQGYYYSKPLGLEELIEYINAN